MLCFQGSLFMRQEEFIALYIVSSDGIFTYSVDQFENENESRGSS